MVSGYVEFIEHNIQGTREKLEEAINEIETSSLGLMSVSRTIETLV